jgi:hypothetical protein
MLAPEQPVIASLGECQGLDEIPLRERACGGAVVAHPRGQERGLSHGGEQLASDGLSRRIRAGWLLRRLLSLAR